MWKTMKNITECERSRCDAGPGKCRSMLVFRKELHRDVRHHLVYLRYIVST